MTFQRGEWVEIIGGPYAGQPGTIEGKEPDTDVYRVKLAAGGYLKEKRVATKDLTKREKR